jgi:Tfp pilus assembly protein PilF
MSRAVVAISFLLFASGLLGQFNGSVRNAFDGGTVTVTVVGPDGRMAANIRVEIVTLAMRKTVALGHTNATGNTEFSNVPVGSYEVIASRGVDQTTERLEVQGTLGMVTVRLNGDGSAEAGDSTSVSVAQFKVPGKARNHLKKAQKAFDKRALEKAREQVEKALAIHSTYAEALTLRGILNLDQHLNDAAIADFDAAIKIDPGYSLAYFAMGATLNRLHRFDAALQTLERGVALSPQSWQGYFEIAKAQIGKSDYQKALKSLDKAQSLLRDKYPPVHLVKGHALLALKQYGDAMIELQAFLDEAPQAPQSEAARQMLEQARAFAGRE